MAAAAATPEEFYRYFNALVSFRDPALVTRTQQFALSAQVRSQDAPLLLAQLLSSPATQGGTWELLKADWPAVSARLGAGQGIPAIVGGLSAFCSADRAAEVKAFFDTHPVKEAARALQQTLERIGTCVEVKTRQSPAFTRWLAAQK
jgi:hypothetical protein